MMADAVGRKPVEIAPDSVELDRIGSNVEYIFRTSRGIVATHKDARALGQTDGKFRVFASLVEYRDFYNDRESWLEITDPTERRAFFADARVPLQEMNVRPAYSDRARESNFRVGRVFDRTLSLYMSNYFSFTLVTLVASLPMLLFINPADSNSSEPLTGSSVTFVLLGVFLWFVLRLLSQAILVYGAFQSMRGKSVNLFESLNLTTHKLFPLIGITAVSVIGVIIGSMLLIIPGMMLYAAWFVGVPVCMVERLGSWQCLERSAELTRGHRWAIFGIILLLNVGSSIVSKVIEFSFAAIGGATFAAIGFLIGNAIWEAFFAVAVVVTYYELRVSKEGVDIDQIASVFD
jgi:hypothetical protein